MSVAVLGSFAPLSMSAMYLGPFFRLRLRLLCLCLCLVCRLLRRCDCRYGWVLRSSVCVCCVLASVPPFVSASVVFVLVPVPSLSTPPSL